LIAARARFVTTMKTMRRTLTTVNATSRGYFRLVVRAAAGEFS
jgi:hypothetical protein